MLQSLKRLTKLTFIALVFFAVNKLPGQAILPGYNSAFYTNVLSAAEGIAKPFLYQQKYFTMLGLTVNDTVLNYNSKQYNVYDYYMNPATGYYILPASYGTYDIKDFQTIWPKQIPNVFYDSAINEFHSTVDCVGYGTRLLSAVGDTSTSRNAYLNIINTIRNQNNSPFAHKGYVATAYQFAVAFPTLPTSVTSGWEYISGNIEDSLVNAYNQTIQSGLNAYSGVRKGNFAAAQPGDVMAFGYSASSSSNGHFVILEKQPQKIAYDTLRSYMPYQTAANINSLLTRFNVYAVPVFDCSGLYAHFRDSRTQMSGIGHGTLIMFTALSDDAPVGYIFDTLQAVGSTISYDSLGSHVYAISVARFVSIATSLNQLNNNGTFNIYPNPSDGIFNFQITNSQQPTQTDYIEIYNMLGEKIYSNALNIKNSILKIDLQGQPSGIYICKVFSQSGVELAYGKLIKE